MYVLLITCLNAPNYAISYNMMKKHGSCYFFGGDNDSYIHIYILVELSLLATFVGGSESSKERKSQGAKVPGSESSTPGTFAPRSEWSWERKVHKSV